MGNSGERDEVEALEPAAFALATLAVWRLTHLIAAEDGPAGAILRARERAGSGPLGELMDCFYCTSVWAALPFAWRRTRPLLVWLALSGGACLLEQATRTGQER
jgi:hypothetical protein